MVCSGSVKSALQAIKKFYNLFSDFAGSFCILVFLVFLKHIRGRVVSLSSNLL